MRDIAESANTSIGNLYFYFKNKEELLRTLFWEAREPIREWIDAATAELPPGVAPMAVAVYANVLRLLHRERDLTRLFLLDEAPVAIIAESMRQHLEHWRLLWSRNFPDHPADKLELAISMWTGGVQRGMQRWVRGELAMSPLEVAEFVTRWNLQAVGVAREEIDPALKVAERVTKPFAMKA